jgi:hypothetical protein
MNVPVIKATAPPMDTPIIAAWFVAKSFSAADVGTRDALGEVDAGEDICESDAV